MTKDEQRTAARVTAKLRGDRFVLEERSPTVNPFEWRYGAWDLINNCYAPTGADDFDIAVQMVEYWNGLSNL